MVLRSIAVEIAVLIAVVALRRSLRSLVATVRRNEVRQDV